MGDRDPRRWGPSLPFPLSLLPSTSLLLSPFPSLSPSFSLSLFLSLPLFISSCVLLSLFLSFYNSSLCRARALVCM